MVHGTMCQYQYEPIQLVQCANAPMWTNVPIQCQSQSNVPMWTNRIGQSNSYPIHVAIPIHAMWHYQCQFAIVTISYHVIHVRWLRIHCHQLPITNGNNEPNQTNKNQWANESHVRRCERACENVPVACVPLGHKKGHTLRVCPVVWCGVNVFC